MIRVSRRAYRAAWSAFVLILVGGWAIYGVVKSSERLFVLMTVFTVVLISNAAALHRRRDDSGTDQRR